MMAQMLLLIAAILTFHQGHAGMLPLGASDAQAVVDSHNSYRKEAAAAAMQKMIWNTELAQFAERSASQCAFEHTSYESRQNVAGFSYIGENIYTVAGAVDQPTVKDAVKEWADEKKDYDINSNQCATACGHYTQIVWASTTDVGCAIAQCDSVEGFSSESGYVIFCNYGAGGNMMGEAPYERASEGGIGSKCEATFNRTADSDGLCVDDLTSSETTTVTGEPVEENCKWECEMCECKQC